MLNFERASKILEDHFANLTDEKFISNLEEYCPRIFEKEKEYPSLAEAVAEIQRLLQQLEETNPTATQQEQVTYVNIATKPSIKPRAVVAFKDGGETAIDEFILDNKYLNVIKAIAKG
jgi:type IV secretory pathway component VirB8